MQDIKPKPMIELLKMYPEWEPVWKACGNDKNLRYHIRRAILNHHREVEREG